LIFSASQLNLEFHGGVAQLVRARGSYPRRRRFDSAHRHHFYHVSFTGSAGDHYSEAFL
jgi:hypothetical protein